MPLVYFILLLGPLIFFHEFGHFIVARLFKVRVLEFSIGFGPKIGAFQRGDTVYRIGILPLGGYVKMLGADPMEEVQPEQEADSFAAKPLWQRTLIVLAGPVFNLILPIIVFFFVFAAQGQVMPAVVGTLQPDGVADTAGLEPGDVIKSINGEEIEGWWELEDLVGNAAGEQLEAVLERDGEVLPAITLTPERTVETILPELGLEREVGRIQIEASYRRPIVVVDPGGAAAASGLRSWDRIIAVDGEPAERWEYTLRRLQRATQPVRLLLLRDVPMEGASERFGAFEFGSLALAEVTLEPGAGDGTLGLRSAELVVYDVTPGSPEEAAGLRRGDEIVSLNGSRLSSWTLFSRRVTSHPDWTHVVTYARDGVESTVGIEFERRQVKGEFNTDMETTIFGVVNRTAHDRPAPITNTKRISYAMHQSWHQTASIFRVTLASLVGLFTGKVGMEQMGGPIFILEVASRTSDAGWGYFFQVMVWLSISLGLINLIPIPLLDGGHLMFFLIEAIKRGPVSLRTRQIAAYVGFSMIILLMLLVTKNDIGRSWDSIISWFQ